MNEERIGVRNFLFMYSIATSRAQCAPDAIDLSIHIKMRIKSSVITTANHQIMPLNPCLLPNH